MKKVSRWVWTLIDYLERVSDAGGEIRHWDPIRSVGELRLGTLPCGSTGPSRWFMYGRSQTTMASIAKRGVSGKKRGGKKLSGHHTG